MYDQLEVACAIILLMTSLINMYFNTGVLTTFFKMSRNKRNDTSNIFLANQAVAELSLIVYTVLECACMIHWQFEYTFLDKLYQVMLFFFYLTEPTAITSLALNVFHGALSIRKSQSKNFSISIILASTVFFKYVGFCICRARRA